MFNTDYEKLDIATGGDDDRRKSVIETISKLGDKEESEIEKGLKIMTPRQMIARLEFYKAVNMKSSLKIKAFSPDTEVIEQEQVIEMLNKPIMLNRGQIMLLKSENLITLQTFAFNIKLLQ